MAKLNKNYILIIISSLVDCDRISKIKTFKEFPVYRKRTAIIKCLMVMLSLISAGVQASDYAAKSESNISFSALKTAHSSGSLESMVVAEGSYFNIRNLAHVAVLVRHPKGDFLWDTGIGENIVEQMEVFSFFDKQLFSIDELNPAKAQLSQQGYNSDDLMAIIPSHMHWDHASGIEDFLGVPVWIQAPALEEAMQGQPPGFVLSQYDDERINWEVSELTDGPYHGFTKSKDIYGDKSAVLVDLSGHTYGQFGLFLNLDNGEKYFFIGDTTWVLEGVEENQPRPNIVQWLVGVDVEIEMNSVLINQIHKLSLAEPELIIVPAHDENVLARLPKYPAFSGGREAAGSAQTASTR